LIISALALSACGGGGGSSDESQIEEAIETSATSSDPADCSKLTTQAFMEQSTSTEGAAAVKQCEAEVGEDEAESVAVTSVEVEGSEATADAALTGGSFDGQTLEIALVKEGDQWMLNEVLGFAKLDTPKLVESLATQFESNEELSEETAVCIEEGFEESSQPEVEEYLLSGSTEPIEGLVEECS
jgi:hypothetical protein